MYNTIVSFEMSVSGIETGESSRRWIKLNNDGLGKMCSVVVSSKLSLQSVESAEKIEHFFYNKRRRQCLRRNYVF